MSKKKEEERKNLITIRSETKAKIKHAREKQRLDQKEVYNITKSFFKELLELDYEFTHEELMEELQKIYLEKKHHEKLKLFITKVGMIEYTDKKFSEKELDKLLTELETIIDILIKHHSNTPWLVKFIAKLGMHSKKKPELKKNTTEAKEQLFRLLNAVEQEGNEQKAKELYSKSLQFYNNLSKEEKQNYYERLMKTYNKLNKKDF